MEFVGLPDFLQRQLGDLATLKSRLLKRATQRIAPEEARMCELLNELLSDARNDFLRLAGRDQDEM